MIQPVRLGGLIFLGAIFGFEKQIKVFARGRWARQRNAALSRHTVCPLSVVFTWKETLIIVIIDAVLQQLSSAISNH